jgi:hypothetical protein
MPKSLEEAQKLDLILMHLAKHETARFKYKQIMDLLDINLDEAKYLHDMLIDYHQQVQPIISIHQAMNMASRPKLTKAFLKQGGFVEVFKKEQKRIEEVNDTFRVKKPMAFADWLNKNHWLSFLIAVCGFILGLFSLLISLKLIKI